MIKDDENEINRNKYVKLMLNHNFIKNNLFE